LRGEPIPVYGEGANIRDWIFVEDHASALFEILERGRIGETYCISAGVERQNIGVVRQICALVDLIAPMERQIKHASLIRFVADRPGHDLRYAMDSAKLRREIGWQPRLTFVSALEETVAWYAEHRSWWEPILERRYDGLRLGLPRPAPPL
jgi:dTDP-glucose 4,6-dehydratase